MSQAELNDIDLSSLEDESDSAEGADDPFEGRGGHDGQTGDTEYELHENVAIDLIKYIRSNTVKNEQQFLLVALGYLSGYFDAHEFFVCGVLIGTSSSGKSHVQGKIEDLFRDDQMYQATTGTEKSLIYDGAWNDAEIASLDELQKPGETLIEFLKSVHGDDEQFEYKVTAGDAGDGKDRDVDTIIREAKPYWFLYAQSHKDADFEMWNRLLKVPVYESETKNRAVGAMKFDHEHLSLGEDDDVEYNFDFEDGKNALQSHIMDVFHEAPKHVVLPNGSGDHEWDVWEIVEPIFQHNRSESNRIYDMVSNLIRASALLNYKHRDTTSVTEDGETKTALVAQAQDVANVLACRDALLATTHELDRKKKAILTAIRTKGGPTNEADIKRIQEYIRESDSVEVKKGEMEILLTDLEENYLVHKHERAGDRNQHIYEALGTAELGEARVPENEELFEDVHDPITGQSFIASHRERQEQLSASASDFMAEADSEVTSGGDGQRTLGGGGSGRDVTLEPHEEAVRAHVQDALDGETVEGLDAMSVEEFLGLVEIGDDPAGFNVTGTLLDPESECWYQTDKADDWVTNEKDARREVERAIRKLIAERVIVAPDKEMEKGTVTEAKITVLDAASL